MTLQIVAQTGNLRCSWPQAGTVVPHPATFATSCPWPRTKPVSVEKMLAFMKREAIAGRNYAFGHGYVDDSGIDMAADQRIVPQALPASQRPAPVKHLDHPLVSKNGKRLPLRALPWRELNRRFWSRGEVVFADSLERNKARELTLFEKTADPSTMTAEEIWETRNLEPLSESRRSWLERGMGVLALEGVAFLEGSIGEIAQAKGMLSALVTTAEPQDEASAFGRGIAYETVDPITAKQIEWEQARYHIEPAVKVKIVPEYKGLKIVADRRLLPEPLMRLARSVKQTLLSEAVEFDELAGRFRASDDLAGRLGFIDRNADEERERYLAPADEEWHHSFIKIVPQIAVLAAGECPQLNGDWCDTPDCVPCRRPGCSTIECHRHMRSERKVHRSTLRSGADEFWHTELFDVSLFEIGTDGLVDPLAYAITR